MIESAKEYLKYRPGQPRDKRGRWTSSGGASTPITFTASQAISQLSAKKGSVLTAQGPKGKVDLWNDGAGRILMRHPGGKVEGVALLNKKTLGDKAVRRQYERSLASAITRANEMVGA